MPELGSIMMTPTVGVASPFGVPPILVPGDYLVELAFARPLAKGAETLEAAMRAIGWSRLLIEESSPSNANEWGNGHADVTQIFRDPPSLYRFFGHLSVSIAPLDGPEIAWLSTLPSRVDVFADLRSTVEPFEVKQGRAYEIRLMARRKAQPTREATLTDLRAMGFAADKLMLLKRDMRLPGRPGASFALWYGRAIWTKPDSYVTLEDSFYLEDVVALEGTTP